MSKCTPFRNWSRNLKYSQYNRCKIKIVEENGQRIAWKRRCVKKMFIVELGN